VPASAGHEFQGRITVYVLFASLVAASGGLLFGYDLGVTGGYVPLTSPATMLACASVFNLHRVLKLGHSLLMLHQCVAGLFLGQKSPRCFSLTCIFATVLLDPLSLCNCAGVTTQPSFLQKFFPDVWEDEQSATSSSSWCRVRFAGVSSWCFFPSDWPSTKDPYPVREGPALGRQICAPPAGSMQ